MEDSVQLTVVKISNGNYKVIAQDEHKIIRSGEISKYDIINHLHFELDQLKVQALRDIIRNPLNGQ